MGVNRSCVWEGVVNVNESDDALGCCKCERLCGVRVVCGYECVCMCVCVGGVG